VTPPADDVEPVPLREALPTWVRVAALSFGGPAGQIAVMHRLVVDERRWVPEHRFLHAMSYCMLLPGPEAQQLATYLGWLLHGRWGGLVAGTLFILPGFVSLFVLSVLYAEYRDTALVEGLFYGLKPAVMAVVVAALIRIGKRTLVGRDRRLTAATAFVAIFFLGAPFPLIVLAAGAVGFVRGRGEIAPVSTSIEAPSLRSTLATAALWLTLWFAPFALLMHPSLAGSVLLDEAIFFSKSAVVTFGGAYAVLSYIAQQAVEVYGWLAPGEMLDGLGMAETTPGPLIQVVQFVGFMGAYRNPGPFSPLVAGALGSVVTAWVTFVPCFLFVLVGAPWAERLRGRPRLQGALQGITAAVVGVILNLAVWFAIHALFAEVETARVGPLRLLTPDPVTLDPVALLLAVAAAVAMLRFRVGMLSTLGAAAVVGLLWSVAFG
jgi:chromate transporter